MKANYPKKIVVEYSIDPTGERMDCELLMVAGPRGPGRGTEKLSIPQSIFVSKDVAEAIGKLYLLQRQNGLSATVTKEAVMRAVEESKTETPASA